jgi:hypothetical protein
MADERVLIKLPADWYEYVLRDGASEEKPGIYEWQIEGAGSYIGKYGRIRRPTKEYRRNVTRLLNCQPYRKSKPDRYRRIHHELALAHREKRKITLIILENVDPSHIDKRERALINLRGKLNGPQSVAPAVICRTSSTDIV